MGQVYKKDMEKEYLKNTTSTREKIGDDNLLRSISDQTKQTSTSDFGLQWGNRKRLRCMKVQVKDDSSTTPVHKTTVRIDRRVMRSEKESSNPHTHTHSNNGYLNLRHRSSPPPPPPPPPQRILRNSDTSIAMRGQINGGARRISSPEKGAHDKKGGSGNNNNYNHKTNNINEHNNNNNKSAASSDTAHDSKKGGSSSGSGDAAAAALPVWPPKFVIGLTNREKEEDFLAIKGSKLPQRPKKRAKFIQRTLNLVSPGGWLAELTLERYEVREKKITKKRPRGLKAMGNMESDSE